MFDLCLARFAERLKRLRPRVLVETERAVYRQIHSGISVRKPIARGEIPRADSAMGYLRAIPAGLPLVMERRTRGGERDVLVSSKATNFIVPEEFP